MISRISSVSSVSNVGGIGSNSSIAVVVVVGGERGVGDIAGVVGMSGGNSVGVRKSSGNLADGVGISISLSISLVEVVDRGGISGSIGGVGVSSIAMTSIAKMSGDETVSIADSGDVSGLTIIGSLQGRNASVHLSNGVGIGVSI